MPARRELSMRQLRHLLRLHHDGVSAREIGRRLGVARSTIQDNLKRAAAAGLKWPLGEDVTDDALELELFGRAGIATGQRRRVEPDWAEFARELKRPGVTMAILWEEYREVHPDGYGYSRYVAVGVMWPMSADLSACCGGGARLTQHKSAPRLADLKLSWGSPWIICPLPAAPPITAFKTRHSPTSGTAICAIVPHKEQGPRSSKSSAMSSYGSRDILAQMPPAASA
ncbi:MAG TPA: helix-turn-helix domain-containing protein [Stellaceae bacterium]|nr:helix-turn-helix domain-containing protein [Stellaceae bacterium]